MRACLAHIGDSRNDKLVSMVRLDFVQYSEEHFAKQPGVDSETGLKCYEDARVRYGLRDKETMYPVFLERLTGSASKRDAAKSSVKVLADTDPFVLFYALVDFYTKSCIEQIGKQMARIRQ